MIEALGVETWEGRRPPPRRLKVSDFPMLASQKRSAFGFHQVGADGIERCPPPVVRASVLQGPVRRAGTVATAEEAQQAAPQLPYGWRPARLLTLLHELADQGAALPSTTALGRMMGLSGEERSYYATILSAVKSLQTRGALQYWAGVRQKGAATPRAIRLQDGRVLCNASAPVEIPWGAAA